MPTHRPSAPATAPTSTSRPRVLDVVYATAPDRGTPPPPRVEEAPPHDLPRITARVPWERLRIVGMLRVAEVVQTGEAAPIYALDAAACGEHGLPVGTLVAGRPSFSLYDNDGEVAQSLQVTGLWRPGTHPPGLLFTEASPQAALAAATDPTWLPTPTAGRFLAVLRSDVWNALRTHHISPPWRFYRVAPGPGQYPRWVAAVEHLRFRAWRRETAWQLLTLVRPILREARLAGGVLDKTPGSAGHVPGCPPGAAMSTTYFRATRLAFALAPQRSTDRTAMRVLFAMLARDDAEYNARMVPVRTRSTDPDALVRFAEAWLSRDDVPAEYAPDPDTMPPDLPVFRADAAVPGSELDDRPDNTLEFE
jgi:hypothetical protein